MAKNEAPIAYLKKYIPEPAAEAILAYLNKYKVHLTITRERRSILGDYRHATSYTAHRISINGNLNTYSFLITLIHELAHLVTFEKYGHKSSAHGRMEIVICCPVERFLSDKIFPPDILQFKYFAARFAG